MTSKERYDLRCAAENAVLALRERARSRDARDERWLLQTSNSFRRIGCHGDGDVLCGTKHPIDGHPDLLAAPAVLDYIVAAQPEVVLALLDALVLAENKLEVAREVVGEINALAKDFGGVDRPSVERADAANKVARLIERLTTELQEVS